MKINNDEIIRLEKAVDEFADEMKRKLVKQYVEKGYTGWDKIDSIIMIKQKLADNWRKGKYINVANLAMMLHRFQKESEG